MAPFNLAHPVYTAALSFVIMSAKLPCLFKYDNPTVLINVIKIFFNCA